jgi:hypothetical protein
MTNSNMIRPLPLLVPLPVDVSLDSVDSEWRYSPSDKILAMSAEKCNIENKWNGKRRYYDSIEIERHFILQALTSVSSPFERISGCNGFLRQHNSKERVYI